MKGGTSPIRHADDKRTHPAPSEICVCTHPRGRHHHDKSCLVIVDPSRAKYCRCPMFRLRPEEPKRA